MVSSLMWTTCCNCSDLGLITNVMYSCMGWCEVICNISPCHIIVTITIALHCDVIGGVSARYICNCNLFDLMQCAVLLRMIYDFVISNSCPKSISYCTWKLSKLIEKISQCWETRCYTWLHQVWEIIRNFDVEICVIITVRVEPTVFM